MPKKHPWWRPSKISEEKIKKLEEAFAMDCSVKEACLYAWISIQTMYNWQEQDKELFERLELMRETPVFIARKSVINNMKTDGDLALKYLERKKISEFTPKSEVESNINMTAKVVSLPELLDDTGNTTEA